MAAYNYEIFDGPREHPAFEAFRTQLHVGERAPRHTLEPLDGGEPVALDALWKSGPLVLEFGSFT